MFLVVTNKRDLTTDLVILELQRRKLPYIRLNTEDFAHAVVRWQAGDAQGWQVDLPGVSFVAGEVLAAYFRRPEPVVPSEAVSPDSRLYCAMEWHAALESLYWSLGNRWLNAPHSIALAENKPRQLGAAILCGMKVPPTLVTNDPKVAAAFCVEQEQVVGKPLRQALTQVDGRDSVVFTSRVGVDLVHDVAALRAAPVILQQEIRKAYDVRVTVVGPDVFAATIDSQTQADTQVDWRRSSRSDLAHTAIELPEFLRQQCIELTKSLGLRFGAIDFVLDEGGEYWFLEINPNGQWGWVENRTRQPIAASIVNELERIGAAS